MAEWYDKIDSNPANFHTCTCGYDFARYESGQECPDCGQILKY
jgi:rubrerythrin